MQDDYDPAGEARSRGLRLRGERAAAWLAGLGLPARLVRHGGDAVTVAGWPAEASTGNHCDGH